MIERYSDWSTKEKDSLPDSSFAYVEEGEKDEEGKTKPRSKRHLPYKDADGKADLPHVRNALARLDQTQIPEEAKSGIKKKLEAILEKAKASEAFRYVTHFSFDDSKGLPSMIQLIPIGKWNHDAYGEINITKSDIAQFVRNFNAGLRNGVYITAGHEGMSELPAQGWVTKVEARENGLWGEVDWNELGKRTLSDKQYKFFSPEFYPMYEDPETHQVYSNVLTGGALTKSPYFKELQAIVFSDKEVFNKSTNTMDTKEILKKKKSDLSAEEKAHLKSHKSDLSDAQKDEYSDIIGDDEKEKKEASDKKDKEDKEKKEASELAAKIAAGEKVLVSAAEFAALTEKANKGAEAAAKLEASELKATVGAMVFKEGNEATGRFLPKSVDGLTTFMATLNESQRKAFSALVAELPKANLFKEIGTGAAEGSAIKELDTAVAAKQTANPKMSYSEALKSVGIENGALMARYNEEIKGNRA